MNLKPNVSYHHCTYFKGATALKEVRLIHVGPGNTPRSAQLCLGWVFLSLPSTLLKTQSKETVIDKILIQS